MEKYITSINDISLGKVVNGGSCSVIHEFDHGIYFKRFNEDYSNLNDSLNLELLDTIKSLSDIDGLSSTIRAIDIYRSEYELFGYTMTKLKASLLEEVSDDTRIADIKEGIKYISSDVNLISNNHIKTEDLGGDNILYGNRFYLLDLDLSIVDKNYDPHFLYCETMYNFLYVIFYKLFHVNIEKDLLTDELSTIQKRLKNADDDNFLHFFDKCIDYLDEKNNTSIITLSDVGKRYIKK